jgi:predicted O-methyltransferase YrrM
MAQADSSRPEYVLATGQRAAERLRLLDQIAGPGTRELLTKLGLRAGWNAAEIGCGSGLVALWMAQRVAPDGRVTAVDMSADQLRLARENAATAGLNNISFCHGDAAAGELLRNSFDLVYSRFLMCHVSDPLKALKDMRALLRVGGLLICEDYDAGGILCEPPRRAYARLAEIIRAMDAKRGVDSNIGLKLPRLFREAGLGTPEFVLRDNAYLRGEGKRLWVLTLGEAAAPIVEAGAAAADDLAAICREMETIARDENTLVLVARVAQVWARKTTA